MAWTEGKKAGEGVVLGMPDGSSVEIVVNNSRSRRELCQLTIACDDEVKISRFKATKKPAKTTK